jgi:HIRAN domain
MCSGYATLSASSCALLLAAVLALAAAAGSAQERVASVRLLVQSSPLAGFRYHAAAEVWGELRVGDALELAREPENPHDAGAVSVAWRGRKLGYVPRRENAALAWGLDRGVRLRARVSRLADHPNPARRIEFEVYVD